MAKIKDAFEKLITALTASTIDTVELDTSSRDLPERLRIIAEGFAEGTDLETLDLRLEEAGHEKLYARSFYEAGFIYAFSHGLSYDGWKSLYMKCLKKYSDLAEQDDRYFSGGKITLKSLKEYVSDNSSENMQTLTFTSIMRDEITSLKGTDGFEEFMDRNRLAFSETREKARYYFCKYILLYIEEKCNRYYDACGKSASMEKFALEELSFLKPLTKLKREAQKKSSEMSVEDKKKMLEETSLTPGGIFDEFNYYFFGYVSEDWMDLVFEIYGSLDQWPDDLRIRIAHAMGFCGMNPEGEEKKQVLEKLEEQQRAAEVREEQKDEIYGSGKGYQRGRSGEDYFRSFLLGKRDISRETLISFLLFIRQNTTLAVEHRINARRLNLILHNCGFPQLKPDKDFDSFVMDFLKADDPFDVVEAHVDMQIVQGRNFYLYNVYKNSYCHSGELMEYLQYLS